MKQDMDRIIARKNLESLIKRNYKPSFTSKLSDFFEDILLFFLLSLAIIFRPINLIIGGIIFIIFLLI